MKHATRATVMLVVVVVALRVLASVLPVLMPYSAVIFVMAVIWRVLTYYTK